MLARKIRSLLLLVAGTFILTFSHGIVGECHELPESSYTPVAGTVLMQGPGITDAESVYGIEAYQALPVSIQNMLVTNNIRIYEVSTNSGDTIHPSRAASLAPNGTAVGIAVAPTYQISKYSNGSQAVSTYSAGYIDLNSSRISQLEDHGKHTFMHEVSHQIDHLYLGGYPVTYSYFNASSQPEWQDIYALEKSKIASYSRSASCNVYTAAEAFAEACGMYLSSPEWLQINCPLSYAYVDRVVSWFG